jgi:hypothetical protein
MEVLHRRCCGLDVHKETVVAGLRLVSDGEVTSSYLSEDRGALLCVQLASVRPEIGCGLAECCGGLVKLLFARKKRGGTHLLFPSKGKICLSTRAVERSNTARSPASRGKDPPMIDRRPAGRPA